MAVIKISSLHSILHESNEFNDENKQFIADIEANGEADEMMDSALSSAIENLDSMRDDCESPNEIQNV